MATAIKRIIRDERRRRGEPVSEMEARAPPRGPPDRLMFAFRGAKPSDAAGLRKSDAAGGWGECGLSLGKRRSRRRYAHGDDVQRGRSFTHGSRWPEIERVAGQSKRSLEDVWRGFVVRMSYAPSRETIRPRSSRQTVACAAVVSPMTPAP